MRLTGDRLRLSRSEGRSNPWRILLYLALIVGGVLLTRLVEAGRVQPLFMPTSTPTRLAVTYAQEGDAYFSAGNLEASIEAYKIATSLESNNPELWSQLARVQTYSSDLLTTLEQRRTRLEEARESVEQAVQADPDSVLAHAIRAFVYDWSAAAEVKDSIGIGDSVLVQATIAEGGQIVARLIELAGGVSPEETDLAEGGEALVIFSGSVEAIHPAAWIVGGRTVEITPQTLIRDPNRREEFLAEAETSATRARQLDPTDSLALAFYAEVLVDQLRYGPALDLALQAASQPDAQDLMDVHRVYGTVLESRAEYRQAIIEYMKAVDINPNLTFLYLRIGANYRRLRDVEAALDYFERAARINQRLGFEDPTPYLAIGRTYVQEGEFFIAAINIEHALAIDPSNPEIYARLGSVYFQARNYESAIPILGCALDGCAAAESGQLLCDLGIFLCGGEGEGAQEVGRDVIGLELKADSLEYYYTYGSVLAAYAGHPDFPNACEDADRIFRKLEPNYGKDKIVRDIIDEGRAICASPSPDEPIPTITPLPDDSS